MKKQLVIELVLCLFCAFLLSLSFSSGQYWIFAWVSFVPLFIALDNKGAKKALLLSYFTGVVFWSGTVYWLIHVTFIGQVILILYLAFYFGIFGLLLSRPFVKCRILFIPFLWVALEYLRGHLFTGFPWALLGYSQYSNLAVIQIADIAGVWIVSFLVMLINTALSDMFIRRRAAYLYLAGLLLTVTVIYGFLRLNRIENTEALKISVIQGNIPQELKWNSRAREFVMERYFKLTAQALKDAPDLIIWPEASLPVIPEEEPVYYERLQRFTKTLGRPLLFGAVTRRNELYYNSALLLSKEGKLLERYDKLHLVPFGEYIPFRRALSFLETIAPIGDIASGKDFTLFEVQRHRFGVLICFEDVFPELARDFVNKGADFLVNITNDAWFGKTSEAYQHLAASVFRAVENRVYLVRAANTGVSGFITPQGKTVSLVNDGQGNLIFTSGFKTQDIFIHGQPSFYRTYGDFLIALCFLGLLFLTVFSLYKKALKKALLILLFIVSGYYVISFYFIDKYYFLSPINYSGDFIIRSDIRGDGFFGSHRNGSRTHQGIDLFAEVGTPVLAARSGIVIQAKSSRGMGNYVIIRHSLKLATIYGHLSWINVSRNQFIRQGHIIGSVGKTGNANYRDIQPHLHFEVKKNGIPQDPLGYLE